MGSLFIYIICLVIYLIMYQLWGRMLNHILKWNIQSLISLEIIGFFVYFAVFQVITLPLICLKKSLTLLSIIWIIINILVISFIVVFTIIKYLSAKSDITLKNKILGKTNYKEQWTNIEKILAIIAVCAVLFLGIYAALQYYVGWDTAYYMGTMNTSVYTDTLYQYDGNSGLKEKYIDFRYAMSSFYMNTSVVAKITGIPILGLQRFVVKPICAILFGIIFYKIGIVIFKNDKVKALIMIICAVAVNFIFVSIYTTSEFLIMRGYEAKGYCANVVLPATLLCLIAIWYENEEKKYWQMLFLIGFSNVAVSMSAIMLVPALIATMILADTIITKRWKNFLFAGICITPNICYLIIYFLYTREIFMIGV